MATQQMSVTMTGFAAAHPRRHPSITKLVTFRMASTPRWNDNGEWKDGGTLFIDVQCWGKLADHVMQSVVKGAPLVLTGRMSSFSFKPENGGREAPGGETYTETIWRVTATNVGLDLSHSPSTWSLRDRVKDAAPGGRGGTPPGEDVGGYASMPPVGSGPGDAPPVGPPGGEAADAVGASTGAPHAPGDGPGGPVDGVPGPVAGPGITEPEDGELAAAGYRIPF